MGLWDTIRGVATKAKCGAGFHNGVFTTPSDKPACYFEKTCPDCNKLIVKNNHDYPERWENAPYDLGSQIRCTRKQQCNHCNEVAKKEIHAEYRKLGINAKCQEIMACGRCGHEKTGEYAHSFIRDGQTEKNEIVLKCVRCDHKETKRYI